MAKYFLYTFFSLASAFGLLAIKKREIEKEYGLSSAVIVRDCGTYYKRYSTLFYFNLPSF